MVTAADPSKYLTDLQRADHAGVDMNWWVPRRLEGSATLSYPDVSLLSTRLDTPWPPKMDDLTIPTRPIASDWMSGEKEASRDSFVRASGAHAFGGKMRSAHSGSADGQVETQS